MSLDNREEVIWAGGLFEGEGHVGTFQVNGYQQLRLTLKMADEDSVQRFADAMGFGRFRTDKRPPSMPEHHKSMYVWTTSNFERVQAALAAMWPWLGKRRRETAKAAIAKVLAQPRQRGIYRSWAA